MSPAEHVVYRPEQAPERIPAPTPSVPPFQPPHAVLPSVLVMGYHRLGARDADLQRSTKAILGGTYPAARWKTVPPGLRRCRIRRVASQFPAVLDAPVSCKRLCPHKNGGEEGSFMQPGTPGVPRDPVLAG
ncbi:hypothetical protein ColLi_00929 [Colletotrichum liriopes]|uniref:Uncharacterized protein n=1 Tax=Colletotrichum liriopes TaxID=708192 RepID=A0AA37GBX7_9PEZI|nr:hypothetical protein ColLi_00929 [Colletotrichum liriopes]